jgi:paraquat-inducible protein B
MSRRASPAIVGTFVLGGVALMLIGLLVLGGGGLFRRNHTFVAYFRGSVTGLVTGAAVKFKGVDVGSVRDVQISIANDEQHPEETRIPVLIDLDERKLVARGATIDWDDPTMIARLIKQGLRVQLATASYVTGIRYIALDMFPGSPAALGAPDPTAAYPELPVMSSGLEEVQRQVDDLLARLARVDIAGLVTSGGRALDSANDALHSVQHAAAAVDALVSAPELKETVRALRDASVEVRATIQDVHHLVADLRRQAADVGQNVDRASASAARVLERAAGVMASAQGILSADAPVVRRLEQALSDVSDAARSFRRLTDKLERDPGAILRGGNK